MNTVQEQWNAFSKLVVPKDASPYQKQEMRRSFYAGAEAMLRIQFAITEPSISENAAVEILEGLNQELTLFANEVKKGNA